MRLLHVLKGKTSFKSLYARRVTQIILEPQPKPLQKPCHKKATVPRSAVLYNGLYSDYLTFYQCPVLPCLFFYTYF